MVRQAPDHIGQNARHRLRGGIGNRGAPQFRRGGSAREKYILRADVRASGTWYELAHDRVVEPILADNVEWRGHYRNPVEDGRLASGGSDGEIKLCPKDFMGFAELVHCNVKREPPDCSAVSSLGVLPDGQPAAATTARSSFGPKDFKGEPGAYFQGGAIRCLTAPADGRLAQQCTTSGKVP
jgi:hypothetical protein